MQRFLVLILILLNGIVHAQKAVYYTQESGLDESRNFNQRADTTLNNIHNYDPNFFKNQNLGNVATPYRSMIFEVEKPFGFQFGLWQPSDYFFSPEKSKYYKTELPFTSISYIQGQRKADRRDNLLWLDVFHTQNFGKVLNVSINVRSIGSNGLYAGQTSTARSGQINSNYETYSKRYQLLTCIDFNRGSNDLNGGVDDEYLFEQSTGATKYFAARLNESTKYLNRGSHWYASQYFRFGPMTTRQVKVEKKDTSYIDTIVEVDAKAQFKHTLHFQRLGLLYQDNQTDSSFFKDFYFSTTQTHDSIHINALSNEVSIVSLNYKHLSFGGGAIHDWYDMRTGPVRIGLNNLSSHLFASMAFGRNQLNDSLTPKRGNLKLDYRHCWYSNYKEFNQGDYNLRIGLNSAGSVQSVWNAFFESRLYAPSLQQVYHRGNHFFWYKGSFEKTSEQLIGGSISSTRLKNNFALKLQASNLKNYIYFDSLALPTQHVNAIRVVVITAEKSFTLSAFNLSNKVLYQYTDNADVMRLPKLLYNGNLYYQAQWFKKAMTIQIGAGITYFSKYRAMAFMPSTQIFYNSTNVNLIGNYPLLDGFVNMQVKTLRVFVKLEHINQDLSGFSTKYYISPTYPYPLRALRFGFIWNFYN